MDNTTLLVMVDRLQTALAGLTTGVTENTMPLAEQFYLGELTEQVGQLVQTHVRLQQHPPFPEGLAVMAEDDPQEHEDEHVKQVKEKTEKQQQDGR